MWCKTSSILISFVVIAVSGGFCLAVCPSADLTGDCIVDYEDFALMADQWLTVGVLDPCNLVWVDINDPGVPGHEGFTGYMSKYETTNGQYCQYLNSAMNDGLITVYNSKVYAVSDPSHSYIYFDGSSSYSQITYIGGVFSVLSRDGYSMADHPVVMVSWYGARAFCDYYGYRLPTEWEWQAVADYNGSYTYGCGTTISLCKANYYDSGYANPLGLSSFPYTSPVDHYPSYGYGMNDMAGGVWEWTSSLWFLYSEPVIRGGCWDNYDSSCTVASRNHVTAYLGYGNVGFRVCR